MKTKLLLYCTKAKPSLNLWRAIGIKEDVHKAICEYTEMQVDEDLDNFMNVEFVEKYPKYAGESIIFRPTYLNGKIVAECECEVEEITSQVVNCGNDCLHTTKTMKMNELLSKSCLTLRELDSYLGINNGYALHLTNIKVFEKPVELKECEHKVKYKSCSMCPHNGNDFSHCNTCEELKPLTKAPQNMMQVWYNGEIYTLVSIRPEWLCKILNGEKTIEVRRKILKGMM